MLTYGKYALEDKLIFEIFERRHAVLMMFKPVIIHKE